MDVLVTRYIGIRGTAIIARARYDELIKRYPEWLVNEACSFDEGIGEMPELLSADNSFDNYDEANVIYAKEYVEFGIFEALFQMSKELKCGLEINIKDIPIKQETVEICEAVGANPYALYSGYSAVMVADDGVRLQRELESRGIPAFIIGHTTSDNDKILINEDERSFLPHIRKDELKNILGRREYHERTDTINFGK